MKDRIRRGIRVGAELNRREKNADVERFNEFDIVQVAPLMFAGVADKTAVFTGISALCFIVAESQRRFKNQAVGQTEKNEEHDQGEKCF